jgi:hypothetical protein
MIKGTITVTMTMPTTIRKASRDRNKQTGEHR